MTVRKIPHNQVSRLADPAELAAEVETLWDIITHPPEGFDIEEMKRAAITIPAGPVSGEISGGQCVMAASIS